MNDESTTRPPIAEMIEMTGTNWGNFSTGDRRW
jgi:hypothetical protein